MRITVITKFDTVFDLEVSGDLDLKSLKLCCEDESGLKSNEMVIMYQETVLNDDDATLLSYGIKEGDIVVLEAKAKEYVPSTSKTGSSGSPKVPSLDFSSIVIPKHIQTELKKSSVFGNPDLNNPEEVRASILGDPNSLALLKQINPELAEAAVSGDMDSFKNVLSSQLKDSYRKFEEHKRLMELDPYDPQAQQLIAEEIRKENVTNNMETAMEFTPESFGLVVMLYINCKVNGVPVKAFIDSGAQATLMSVECANRCNIMRLIDTRFAGVAKGVGVQKVLGRVHLAVLSIEDVHLSTSFSVLEQSVDMLLGLDMLRRHQCCIDLKNNVLRIGTTGTETSFLAEADLPPSAKLSGSSQASSSSLTNTSRSSAEASTSLVTNFADELVNEIVNLGFSRSAVLEELKNNNGDKLKTIDALLAKNRTS